MKHENYRIGKGYYIALIACLAAVGISGYVFVQTAQDSAVETIAETPPAVTEYQPQTTPMPEDKLPAAEDTMEDAYEESMALPEVAWPIKGSVTTGFSADTLTYSATMEDWRTHQGLDIAATMGDLVTATQDGTVTAVYRDDFLGNVVMISHSGDLTTLYANLMDSTAVTVGDTVRCGQNLGQVGTSALLEAGEDPHLHFEVFSQGENIDPMEYLPQ